MNRHSLILIFSLSVAFAMAAQQPATPPATRLRQMEAIYQKELSSRHIPLLGKYLVELQRQAASAKEKTAYQAEISRIQQIIGSGGVVDLIAAQQAQSNAMPMPPPTPEVMPPERKQALIVLSPALANKVVPVPAPNSATAVLGEAEWRIEAIAAGTYDVLVQYACPEITTAIPLSVEFNGQTVEKALDTERATKDAESFRIFRIGSLTLTSDHRGETLRFAAGDKTSPRLILKSILITKPRPAN